MYRVSSHIFNNRYMLYCRPAAKFQQKSVSLYGPHLKYKKATERDTCPRPLAPPPASPPKDDRAFWGALSLLVLAGGFAFYAKQSPEMRDWLTLHAPWFDDFIAIVYQENMTYKEFAEQCVADTKKYFSDTKPKQCSLDGQEVKHTEEKQASPPPGVKPEDVTCNRRIANEEESKGEPGKKAICDYDYCLKDLAEDIINNYITARDACIYYNQFAEDIISECQFKNIKLLDEAKEERKDLIRQSEENIRSAKADMDELARYVECGGLQAPKEKLDKIMCTIAELRAKIAAIRKVFEWEHYKSDSFDKQVRVVEAAARSFMGLNQTLFPGLNYEDKKPALRGDVDMFLLQNLRFATSLKDEMCKATCNMTHRIDRALENLPADPEQLKKREHTIQEEYKKRKEAMDKDYKRREDELKHMNEKILKMHLGGHEEALQAKLAQKEKEVYENQDRLIAEKVGAEKKIHAEQLAAIEAKIKEVEERISERLEAERHSRHAQELYAAGASLMAATRRGDPVVRIDKELKAIEKASGGEDKLVLTILKSIPESVRTDGIVPESILRERYNRMEKAALRVALVDQEGGPLPIFFMSWLQYMLLSMKVSSIPQHELDKPPPEPSKDLDTFDLLQRARYWIERGNLPAALRYISSLEGASRLAASTWFNQARSFLETKQAAEAVLAHATALGLQYV